MTEKEIEVQKALGTFNHLKCKRCGKVSHRNTLNNNCRACEPFCPILTAYQCECGAFEFENIGEGKENDTTF